jgi:hypothetical protein
VESAPRAYRLKASNAAPLSSTSAGTFPGIAARQLHALRQHYTGKLRLSDVKEIFLQMKDYVILLAQAYCLKAWAMPQLWRYKLRPPA